MIFRQSAPALGHHQYFYCFDGSYCSKNLNLSYLSILLMCSQWVFLHCLNLGTDEFSALKLESFRWIQTNENCNGSNETCGTDADCRILSTISDQWLVAAPKQTHKCFPKKHIGVQWSRPSHLTMVTWMPSLASALVHSPKWKNTTLQVSVKALQ